jgi:HEAT repeat protein
MSQPQNIDDLLDQLQNGLGDDPDARWRAARDLGAVEAPNERARAVAGLLSALTTGRIDATARATAVESLGRLGDPLAVPALTQALNDPYRLVRSYAVAPLAALGDVQQVLPLLLNLLTNDEFFGVRAEAASGVTTLAIRSGDATVRQQVRDALTQQRAIEVNRGEPGSVRVIAEIDRQLARLDSTP